MRTIFTALVAALLLSFGVATAVSAQEAEATAEAGASATNDGDTQSATAGDVTATDSPDGETASAGDAVAIDDDCDEAATAGDAVAVDDDDVCEEPAPAPQTPQTPQKPGTTTPPTNLPRTGVGTADAANGGLLVALAGLAAVGLGAAAWRLRRA